MTASEKITELFNGEPLKIDEFLIKLGEWNAMNNSVLTFENYRAIGKLFKYSPSWAYRSFRDSNIKTS